MKQVNFNIESLALFTQGTDLNQSGSKRLETQSLPVYTTHFNSIQTDSSRYSCVYIDAQNPDP